jgi:3-hydroxyacyl-[acyl-carrier-protein] dehydratase
VNRVIGRVNLPSPEELLSLIPHTSPFRFVDRILEVDDDHIVGQYRFREDEYFYLSHFPGSPITPGVILVEAMAQIGVVAFGLFLAGKSEGFDPKKTRVLLTEVDCDFTGIVRPREKVTVRAQKIYFRRSKLKVAAEMSLETGTEVCSGMIAGVGFHHD